MLQRLLAKNLRCFDEVSLDLPAGGAVFIGKNGVGKTTLLEAMCLLMRLQSPRTKKKRELVKFEEDFFMVEGSDFEERIFRYGFQAGKQKISIDSVSISNPKDYLIESGKVVWMGNQDIELVRKDSAGRRRFIDFMGSQVYTNYLPMLRRYEKGLKFRNRLLKELRPDWKEIEAYDPVIFDSAKALVEMREELVADFRLPYKNAHASLGDNHEGSDIHYVCDTQPNELEAAFFEKRDRDSKRGFTTSGPHRDDLELLIEGRPSSSFGSEGQQRTVALALKLAQAKLFEEKSMADNLLILIDDVFGELDIERRNLFLRSLPDSVQTFITTTNLNWIQVDEKNLKIFTIENGVIK